jgi:GNAT superfamily N-acetyltransferase
MTLTNGAQPAVREGRLPTSNSPMLILSHPTREERLRHLRLNGVEWRAALPLEAYLRREDHLADQDATRDGGLTSWILVDEREGKDRRILSGCESIRKRALVAYRGRVTETIAHSVGSVFCPEDLRGRGYGGRMIRDLGEVLKSWQAEHCLVSTLFSDVGKVCERSISTKDNAKIPQKFYALHGWRPFPSSHITLPPGTSKFAEQISPIVRPLRAEDLLELCALDESLIRHSLKQASSPSCKAFVALIPDIQTIRWHHAREEFVGYELYGETPEIKGAIVGDEVGRRVWCYWNRMWYNEDSQQREENTLHILRLVVEEKGVVDWETCPLTEHETNKYASAIAALLAMAQDEAARWQMEDVQIWNPNQVTVDAARRLYPSTEVVHRDQDSICSLRWYGDDEALNNIVWLGNEKYGWC